MIKAPILGDEEKRLSALRNMGILDGKNDPEIDVITREVAGKLSVPICTVSIIDADREWYKSNFGYPFSEGKRADSFCGHALYSRNIFIIEDTLKDERFLDNPNVIGGPKIRFYAGVALYDKFSKLPVGVLCVKDIVPKKLSLQEIDILISASEKVEAILNSKSPSVSIVSS